MRVEGYRTTWNVNDEESLEAALTKRDAHGGGEFWLSAEAETYPCLAIRVSENHSDLHYFPEEATQDSEVLEVKDCRRVE